jgi:serine/threonine protein kinase
MSSASEDPLETRYLPPTIGRYAVDKLIGSGGFGSVYLARDEILNRQVAIKVPHRRVIEGSHGAEEYLREARLVANLDHPNIVPVYDVGSTEEIACFIVSKYIRYTDLRRLLKKRQVDTGQAVELAKKIAEALHFAHKREIVHRDIKPSNILIDDDGTPYLADFGLALPEYDQGKGPRYAGTPAYMSPEQARGEGHRVDGRSDIFSLGTVLYEMIAGRRPFKGESNSDLLEQVEFYDPKPLRQIDEKIPKELDRICQKAMAKRASERYSTAHDLAEDLGYFWSDLDRGMRRPRSPMRGLHYGRKRVTPTPRELRFPIRTQPMRVAAKPGEA